MNLTHTPFSHFIRLSLAFALFGLILSVAGSLSTQAASVVPGQSISIGSPGELVADALVPNAEHQIVAGNFGIIDSMIASNARITTPDGQFTGPSGVQTFTESLTANFPAAQFAVTDFNVVGSLLIVDWAGTVEGNVVFSGRTLAMIDSGAITDVFFLSQSNLAPL